MSATASADALRVPRSASAWAVAGLLALASPGAAQTEVYDVDPEASRVRIHLGRAGLLGFLGHDHEIDAPIREGTVDVVPDDPAASRIDVRWDAAALAVVPGTEPEEDVPEVEERMRGPEVLDVQSYGQVRLWSFDVAVDEADPDAGRWRLRVRAGLELKGARHTVTLPVEVRRDGESLVASGEAELRLRRIGVEPPSVAGVVNVSDEFRVRYELHARRRSGPEPAPQP